MQDPSTYTQIKPQFPEQEHLKCPRCDSDNTKFCYYNNYNLSQPRHFCKNCRRYWTKGGTLRNIPVGGGSRKNTKRSSNPKRSTPPPATSTASSPATQFQPKTESSGLHNSPAQAFDINGSFSSLLASGQFGSLMDGVDPSGSAGQLGEFGENPDSGSGMIQDPPAEFEGANSSEGFLGIQSGGDSSCWNGANGWPGLAIFRPGQPVSLANLSGPFSKSTLSLWGRTPAQGAGVTS
ncbi:hypothetical protein RJ640_008508 [Escallonia rubra]|uniref:Dof zinc finger protein n=1 Tax=Escallonia rubra TaxID=112253 RepID=A0AA88RAZ0_9ASTE|nr:hypothetical protein RJ640_008508 [Escallonia rubra]